MAWEDFKAFCMSNKEKKELQKYGRQNRKKEHIEASEREEG